MKSPSDSKTKSPASYFKKKPADTRGRSTDGRDTGGRIVATHQSVDFANRPGPGETPGTVEHPGASLDAEGQNSGRVMSEELFLDVTDDDTAGARAGRINVPTGFAAFPYEMVTLAPPKSALQRDFNLTRFTRMPKGGHFGCFEQPKLFTGEVREFFRTVRG